MDSGSTGAIYTLTTNNANFIHSINNHPIPQQSGTNPVTHNDHPTVAANAFNSLAVIEHLQQTIKQEQNIRLGLEKELVHLRQKVADLQRQLLEQKNLQQKTQEFRRVELESIKKRLMMTVLKSSINDNDDGSSVDGGYGGLSSSDDTMFRQIEFLHECDECTFKTKSDVSLILHKMNHKISDTQYLLLTSSFTTRNSNSKSIYKCSACGTDNLTRHQVYRHIYDVHTVEKPLSCDFCDFSFTHKDYLEQHITAKHENNPISTKINPPMIPKSSPESNDGGDNDGEISLPFASAKLKSTLARGRSIWSSLAANRKISDTDLKCTFPDCNFITIYPEKLDFHMQAHINTKYKCPYCPYVSNTIIDIKRHIQKSKKHNGLKVFSCQKCSFAADCDRTFKEHLRGSHFGHEVADTVIDYYIDEMFSNKNQRKQDEENEKISRKKNKSHSSSVSGSTLNSSNDHDSSNNVVKNITTTTTTIERVDSSTTTGHSDTNMFPLPKKMRLQSRSSSNSIDNQQQQQQPIYNDLHRSGPQSTVVTIENQHQALNLHSTSNQNTLVYPNLELVTMDTSNAGTEMIQFTTQTNDTGDNQQQQNLTTIPVSAIELASNHQHSQHRMVDLHHHHQQQQQQTQNSVTLLSIPEDFVQAALSQTTLVAVQQPLVNDPSSVSSNHHHHHHHHNNNRQNSVDTNGLGNTISESMARQYYTNY